MQNGDAFNAKLKNRAKKKNIITSALYVKWHYTYTKRAKIRFFTFNIT